MALYHDIALKLRTQIEAGTFRPGTRLPSTRKLCGQLAISMTTITRALRELEGEGLIKASERSAWSVVAKPRRPQVTDTLPPTAPALVGTTGLTHDYLRTVLDPSLIPLGRAEPSLDLLPAAELSTCLREALRRNGKKMLAYEHPIGNRLLREELARLSVSWGCTLAPDDFIITNGCTEAIHLALQVTTQPGDVVAIETPTFYGILQAVAGLGLHVVTIPSQPITGLDLSALKHALKKHPIRAVLTVPSFNNPVGGCMSQANRRELARLMVHHNITLIEDDLYGDLAHDNTRPACVKAHDKTGQILLCGSVSKTLAPGYRIGWLAAGAYRDVALAAKLRASYSTATPLQHALGIFLRSGGYERHLRKMRAEYRRRVTSFISTARAILPSSTCIHTPLGGYLTWLQLPPGVSALELSARMLRRGISIAPGSIFTPQGTCNDFIRLHAGYGSAIDTTSALRGLAACLG